MEAAAAPLESQPLHLYNNCSAGLLEMKSVGICMSEKVLISSLILKAIFTGYGI